ncbi:pentapeptide repeat-containing protein [Lactiplantibacillus garii]|uniref:Pentapeptide repeat-containing protein n=1 Tax=Lactiplantibacillus garii TaxID=2306423 RepID=A0A3R8KKX4_9LACO|nr:pentapeptide repeat-containing protein [Lactiplantibacillus garii]RRK10116.1 pentapeptide repeat-containing protein [Lactiplantibacillus garii]
MDQPRITPADLPAGQFNQILEDEDHLLDNCRISDETIPDTALVHPMFDHVSFENVTFTGRTFERLEITDAEFIKCDFSNCHFEKASLLRVQFKDCKMVGLDLTGAFLNNVSFDNDLLDLSMLCDMKLKATHFNDCRLTDASVMNDRLTRVQFNRCDLDQVSFYQTALKNIDLSTCHFERLDLEAAMARGMSVNLYQAANLAAYFNGIHVK